MLLNLASISGRNVILWMQLFKLMHRIVRIENVNLIYVFFFYNCRAVKINAALYMFNPINLNLCCSIIKTMNISEALFKSLSKILSLPVTKKLYEDLTLPFSFPIYKLKSFILNITQWRFCPFNFFFFFTFIHIYVFCQYVSA